MLTKVFDGRAFTVTAILVSSKVQSGAIVCPTKLCGRVYKRGELAALNPRVHGTVEDNVSAGEHAWISVEFRCDKCRADIKLIANDPEAVPRPPHKPA